MLVRDAAETDRLALREILDRSPEAGSWPAIDWSPPRRCLVAEEDGRVLGLLLASCPAPDEAEILTLAVHPEHRRRGAGSALLRTFLAGRCGRVLLEVRSSNLPARRLYERFGFTEFARRRGYYQSPPEDAVVLRFTGAP
jgi:ribosomal-protein-alanine acetyltransferase